MIYFPCAYYDLLTWMRVTAIARRERGHSGLWKTISPSLNQQESALRGAFDSMTDDFNRETMRTLATLLLEQPNTVILDTETTSLKDAELVQVAVVDAAGTLLDTPLCPTGEIAPDATAVHGKTKAALLGAPVFADVYPRLREALDGKVVVGYNVAFDRRVIERECARAGVDVPRVAQWVCAMEMYATYRSAKWVKLPGAQHSALKDCQAVVKLLREMADGSA